MAALALARLGAQGGFGDGRVFGPGVFGILTAHILAHVTVGTGPETRQIQRDLNGAPGR